MSHEHDIIFPLWSPRNRYHANSSTIFFTLVLEELIKQACTVATSVFRPWHSLRSFTPVGGIEEWGKNQVFNIVKGT